MGTRMSRRTTIVLSAALLLGVAIGGAFVVTSNESDPEFDALSPPPDFLSAVTALVVEGDVVSTDGLMVTIRIVDRRYESDVSREKIAESFWPGDQVEVRTRRYGDQGPLSVGDHIVAFFGDRARDQTGPWRSRIYGIVMDDGTVQMQNDDAGILQGQLETVAAGLGVGHLEALTRIAEDVRVMRDASQATGEFPDEIGAAARVLLDRPVIVDNTDSRWYAADPRERGYEDGPGEIFESLVTVEMAFTVEPGVVEEGDQDTLVAIRDEGGVGGGFLASLGYVEDRVYVTPGSRMEIVLRTWDDFIGQVVGTVDAAEWANGEKIHIVIRRSGSQVTATLAE